MKYCDDIPLIQLESAMRRCIELATYAIGTRNYPLGAIVMAPNGEIIGEASSSLVKSFDPSGHPEVVAMRNAAQKLKSRYLIGSWLVSTMEPCPMCASMAIWGKMKGIAFGTPQAEAISFGNRLQHPQFSFRQIRITCREVAEKGEPRLHIIENLLREEANELLEEFRRRLSAAG